LIFNDLIEKDFFEKTYCQLHTRFLFLTKKTGDTGKKNPHDRAGIA